MPSEVAIWSPNKSSRGGTKIRLIVLHTTEGAQDIYSLGNFFANPNSQVSSHIGTDNHRQGTVGRYVSDGDKAWTQGNANPCCLSIEQCTPAGAASGWSRDYWLNHQGWMLDNTAAQVKSWASKYGIPLKALTASQAQGGSAGVCQHSDLGSWGGGHHDCGPGFPMDYIINKAGGSGGTTPPPSGGTSAPAFPYPNDHYIGQPSSDSKCHSGCYGGSDSTNCATWQGQMAHRGWSISVDGCYGNQSENVCRQFQMEKGLVVDGLVGPNTWKTSWTAPIT